MIILWCKLELKRYQALSAFCIYCSAPADISPGEVSGANTSLQQEGPALLVLSQMVPTRPSLDLVLVALPRGSAQQI